MITIRHLLLGAAALSLSVAALARTDQFASAMHAAMTRMHGAMTTGSTGDPDQDFAAMMIPRHQGAIDMARIELEFGTDERLRRLAQGIIVDQQQEIAVMRGILLEHHAFPHGFLPVRGDAHTGDHR